MNLTINVFFRMVNHFMNVVSMEAAITFPAIGEEFRALLYVLPYFAM